MLEVKPNTFLSTLELKEILDGTFKIPNLRKYGLRACPGKGYWSNNVIDSINNYFNNPDRQRVANGNGKEINHEPEFFDKSDTKIQTRQVHTPSTERIQMESQRQRFERQIHKN